LPAIGAFTLTNIKSLMSAEVEKWGTSIMKMNRIFIVAALVASGSAQAASLADAQGQVWVGREKGFTLAQGAAELSPGDRVKVGAKSLARIVYPDGCSVSLGANSLATVAKHSPCSFRAQFGGDTGASPNLLGMGLVGAGVVGAGVGLGLALTRGGGNNNNWAALLLFRPASP